MPLRDRTERAARRVRRVRWVRDENGRPTQQLLVSSEFIIDEDGCINQIETEDQDRFYSCGCHGDQPPGGKCIGCGRVSCAKCFVRCAECRRPLCLACADHLTDDGKELSFCPHCSGPARRWRLANSILSVFEEFKGE